MVLSASLHTSKPRYSTQTWMSSAQIRGNHPYNICQRIHTLFLSHTHTHISHYLFVLMFACVYCLMHYTFTRIHFSTCLYIKGFSVQSRDTFYYQFRDQLASSSSEPMTLVLLAPLLYELRSSSVAIYMYASHNRKMKSNGSDVLSHSTYRLSWPYISCRQAHLGERCEL